MDKDKRNKIIIVLTIFSTIMISIDIKLSAVALACIVITIFSYNPILWIYFMTMYISFEVVITNFLPTSLVGLVRYGVEGVSYFILLVSVIKAIINKRQIGLHKYDYIICFFILFTLISSLFNNVKIAIYIMGLRWIIRYVVIYYIIKVNNFNNRELKKLIKFFYMLVIFEIMLGLIQVVFKEQLKFILEPKTVELEYYTVKIAKIESRFSIYSTFGRYSEYGAFMMLGVIFLFCRYYFEKSKKNLYILGIGILALVLSYARQNLLATVISILIFIYFNKERVKISRLKVSIILFSIIMCGGLYLMSSDFQVGKGITTEGISQRFLSIFSKEFIMSDYNGKGRSYFYTTVNKKFIESKPLFGYGVGMYGTESAIRYDKSVYEKLDIPTQFSMDVYWTSILGQVGIVGLILLIKIYSSFFSSTKNYKEITNKEYRFISVYIRILFISLMICGFFSSNLSDRYQAFYTWMFFGIYDNLRNNYMMGNIYEDEKEKSICIKNNNCFNGD